MTSVLCNKISDLKTKTPVDKMIRFAPACPSSQWRTGLTIVCTDPCILCVGGNVGVSWLGGSRERLRLGWSCPVVKATAYHNWGRIPGVAPCARGLALFEPGVDGVGAQ